MSAVLTLLALVAGLVLYPGGVTLVACAGVVLAAGARGPERRHPEPSVTASARLTGVGIVLASLAVVAVPWPGDPLSAIPGPSAVALGSLGVPLTVAALWAADSLAEAPARSTWLLVHAAWAGGLVGLGLAAGSATWPSVLALAGPGSEAARVVIGVGAAAALPRLVPGRPADGLLWTVRWAAHAAVVTALWVPRIADRGPLAAVGIWVAIACGLLLVHRTAGRLLLQLGGGRLRARPEREGP